jgi:gamma-glutamyltranspeptidase/glutathione hydrolase
LGLIDWKLDMASAIALPNITSRSGPIELEEGRGLEPLAEELRTLGHEVKFMQQTSGLNGFRVTRDGYDAAADKRREGTVGAD